MKSSDHNLSVIRPDLLASQPEISACFTLKNEDHQPQDSTIAGLNLGYNTAESESVVRQNRSILLHQLALDSNEIAYADQVHSNRIQLVSEGGTYGATDGLVTTIPGLALAIQVADCAAVLLWDAAHYVVGAFHAGWRGAVAEIVPRGIQMMLEHGAEADDLAAFISPCISQANFEVGPEVAEQFPSAFVDEIHYAKPHVDLKAFLSHQMRGEGVHPSKIEVHAGCTVADAPDFYSYRREGDHSGRMMGIIQIER